MPRWKTLSEDVRSRVQQATLIRVVDDDDALREALIFVLKMEGWEVAAYASGGDFLRSDTPSKPGCVVLDVQMPGMTGVEVQQVMNERGINLPIVFLTGHGDIDMAVMTMQDGEADFIQKPLDNERLLRSIETAAYRSASQTVGILDAEDARERLAVLTDRESDIARLLSQSLTNRQIGERLGIAVRTVEVHRATVLRKLGVKSTEEIARLFLAAQGE